MRVAVENQRPLTKLMRVAVDNQRPLTKLMRVAVENQQQLKIVAASLQTALNKLSCGGGSGCLA